MVDDLYLQKLKAAGWPQEFPEKLTMGNLASQIGIATLWAQQEVVCRELNPECYAVLGNFYDKRNGFEPFVRNCLANPNIRHIVIVGNDKAGSKQVLQHFFAKGIVDGKIAETECAVPLNIPLEDLELVRANVMLHDLTDKITDLNDSQQYADAIHMLVKELPDAGAPYAEPRLYEKVVLEADGFPSESAGAVIRGQYVGEVWLRALRHTYDYGRVTKMKAKDSTGVRAYNNLVCVVTDEDPDAPKMEPYFRFDEPYLKTYYDEICTDKIPEGTAYTYGSRLRAWQGKSGETIDQIADMIAVLKKDKYRASVISQTWIVEDELTRGTKGSPCIVLVQAYTVDEKLSLTVYIRSNDMFRAWPLNAFGLRKLQKIIAEGVGLPMGSLTTVSCSAHMYEDNWRDAKEIVEKYGTGTNCFYDPRGYYNISLEQGKIVAKHFSPDGQFLKEYTGMLAREMNDQINSAQYPVDAYHSSYLGEEFMKAETALKLGIAYTQDADLDFSEKASAGVCGDGLCG